MSRQPSLTAKLSEVVPSKPSQSAVDYVIKTIKDLLIDGHLNPGDKLPSETELTKLLSVGRGSVREAMKVLSALGVVKIQHGYGTYIADSAENVALDSLLFSFVLTKPTIKEIYDLRLLIETGVMAMAIQNATEENIRELEENLNEMKAIAGRGLLNTKATADLDIKFHAILGEIAGNRLITKIYAYIMSFLSHSVFESHRIQGEYLKSAIDSHTRILDAIKNRDRTKIEEVTTFAVDTWHRLIGKTVNR